MPPVADDPGAAWAAASARLQAALDVPKVAMVEFDGFGGRFTWPAGSHGDAHVHGRAAGTAPGSAFWMQTADKWVQLNSSLHPELGCWSDAREGLLCPHRFLSRPQSMSCHCVAESRTFMSTSKVRCRRPYSSSSNARCHGRAAVAGSDPGLVRVPRFRAFRRGLPDRGRDPAGGTGLCPAGRRVLRNLAAQNVSYAEVIVSPHRAAFGMGLAPDTLVQLARNGVSASFADQSTKTWLP